MWNLSQNVVSSSRCISFFFLAKVKGVCLVINGKSWNAFICFRFFFNTSLLLNKKRGNKVFKRAFKSWTFNIFFVKLDIASVFSGSPLNVISINKSQISLSLVTYIFSQLSNMEGHSWSSLHASSNSSCIIFARLL